MRGDILVLQLSAEDVETFIKKVDFTKLDGLVPAVVQDASTGQILMQAFMNAAALKLTLTTGKMHYWSRSRQTIWMKGETSKNYSLVQNAILDCDNDSILFKIQQIGECCHTGNYSCFHKPLISTKRAIADARILERVFEVITDRITNPSSESYVSNLIAKGEDAILRKIGEETIELLLAVKSETAQRRISEATDLIVHLLILFAQQALPLQELFSELDRRHTQKTQNSEGPPQK
jgi:phosphoribosyl-ATP pyrophosphohydrolase/phosphoribosyl-AMP cyclohydrolase